MSLEPDLGRYLLHCQYSFGGLLRGNCSKSTSTCRLPSRSNFQVLAHPPYRLCFNRNATQGAAATRNMCLVLEDSPANDSWQTIAALQSFSKPVARDVASGSESGRKREISDSALAARARTKHHSLEILLQSVICGTFV